MDKKDTVLTAREAKFVAAALSASSISEAADLAGIAPTTAYRYMQREAVQQELARRQDVVLSQAAAGLVVDVGTARQVLRDTMSSPTAPWAAKVGAARVTLDSALRLVEMATLSKRLAAIEAHIQRREEEIP